LEQKSYQVKKIFLKTCHSGFSKETLCCMSFLIW
jgi:hypothetical protein